MQVLTVLGVFFAEAPLYDPEKPFKCFDGTRTLDFSVVNDDYCDCSDGSDEPGTSACPNSYFHCTNAGHTPLNIPSSRVNDGICGMYLLTEGAQQSSVLSLAASSIVKAVSYVACGSCNLL